MKRSRITVGDVAELPNLMAAYGRAARGKRFRSDVRAFASGLDDNLSALQAAVLDGTYRPLPMRRFSVRDPKPRMIHAPRFRDRVLHHALMAHVGPVLDRSLVDDVYACRVGKGALAAVRRCQAHLRRSGWFCQIDIRGYFPNIPHAKLLDMLARKFSDHDVLQLFETLVCCHEDGPGRGLPIGALTSQAFANAYLGRVDRCIMQAPGRIGYVRYMDDLVWFVSDRCAARQILQSVVDLIIELGLEVRQPVLLGRCRDGLAFCGYRILPDRLLLSRRRKKRFAAMRREVEAAFAEGSIDGLDAQRRIETALSLTSHADARAWRKTYLARVPLADGLEETL